MYGIGLYNLQNGVTTKRLNDLIDWVEVFEKHVSMEEGVNKLCETIKGVVGEEQYSNCEYEYILNTFLSCLYNESISGFIKLNGFIEDYIKNHVGKKDSIEQLLEELSRIVAVSGSEFDKGIKIMTETIIETSHRIMMSAMDKLPTLLKKYKVNKLCETIKDLVGEDRYSDYKGNVLGFLSILRERYEDEFMKLNNFIEDYSRNPVRKKDCMEQLLKEFGKMADITDKSKFNKEIETVAKMIREISNSRLSAMNKLQALSEKCVKLQKKHGGHSR